MNLEIHIQLLLMAYFRTNYSQAYVFPVIANKHNDGRKNYRGRRRIMVDRHWLNRDVPEYLQTPNDNSCGPRVVLMVADSFEKERGRKLYAYEWSRVIEITMRNDLMRDSGTSKRDLVRALKAIGLQARILKGGSKDQRKCLAIGDALARNHPVIVSCRIPYRGKHYRHYAVVVGMDEDSIYLRDPFLRPGRNRDGFYRINRKEFLKKRWTVRDTVWGMNRWGVVVSFETNTNR